MQVEILNFDEIEFYLIKIIYFGLISFIIFRAKKSPMLAIFSVFSLWLIGWSNTPLLISDYTIYINNLEFYYDRWLELKFWGEVSENYKNFELLSWALMYHVYKTTGFDASLQILAGFIQLFSYWFFLRSLRVDGKHLTIAMAFLLVSSSFIYATDWYLRQGVSWAFFLIAIGIFIRYGPSFRGYLGLFTFTIIGVFFHVTVIVYFVLFLLSMMVGKMLDTRFFFRRVSFGAFFIASFLISTIIIIPFKLGYSFNLSGFVLENTPASTYSESIYAAGSIGFIFSIYIFMTLHLFWLDARCQVGNYGRYFKFFLLFLVLFTLLGMMVSSISSRMLLPFQIFFMAYLFSLISCYSKKRLYKNKLLNNLTLTIYIVTLLLYSVYGLVIQGGGMR